MSLLYFLTPFTQIVGGEGSENMNQEGTGAIVSEVGKIFDLCVTSLIR